MQCCDALPSGALHTSPPHRLTKLAMRFFSAGVHLAPAGRVNRTLTLMLFICWRTSQLAGAFKLNLRQQNDGWVGGRAGGCLGAAAARQPDCSSSPIAVLMAAGIDWRVSISLTRPWQSPCLADFRFGTMLLTALAAARNSACLGPARESTWSAVGQGLRLHTPRREWLSHQHR